MNQKYQKMVTFSYDDGVMQDVRLVELFNKYGLKCTFNLNTGIQSHDSKFEIQGVPIMRMNQEEIGNLYEGHEIALHGLTHASPSALAKEEYEKEFLQDAKNIERIYGKYPLGMAYAYGDTPEEVVRYLEKMGIKYGRTTKATHGFSMPDNPILLEATCHHKDEKLMELIDQFLEATPKEGEQMLLYIWGHSYEFDVDDNWDYMEKICQKLSGKQDIFYGTNSQCLGLE